MPSASTVATSSNVTVPFVVNVVLITAFPPELTRWISSLPLNEQLPFPQGNEPSGAPLRLNRSLGVLGITTGMGPMRAAASIVALGHDLRWDLSASYFLVAGIAGVDPQFGSIGSAFVARHLVGIGGGYFLDGVGHIPQGRTHVDFGPPLPTPVDSRAQGVLHSLSSELSAWALGLASTASLPDTPSLQAARARFTAPTEAPARLPPAVRAGDSATGETFGAGFEWTAWARNATAYWGGRAGELCLDSDGGPRVCYGARLAHARWPRQRVSPRSPQSRQRLLLPATRPGLDPRVVLQRSAPHVQQRGLLRPPRRRHAHRARNDRARDVRCGLLAAQRVDAKPRWRWLCPIRWAPRTGTSGGSCS